VVHPCGGGVGRPLSFVFLIGALSAGFGGCRKASLPDFGSAVLAPSQVEQRLSALSNVCANATNGTTCDDGDVCTQGETCQSGVCQATATYPTVLDLPIDDLGGTGIATNATDVNATGTVVGYSLAPDYAHHA